MHLSFNHILMILLTNIPLLSLPFRSFPSAIVFLLSMIGLYTYTGLIPGPHPLTMAAISAGIVLLLHLPIRHWMNHNLGSLLAKRKSQNWFLRYEQGQEHTLQSSWLSPVIQSLCIVLYLLFYFMIQIPTPPGSLAMTIIGTPDFTSLLEQAMEMETLPQFLVSLLGLGAISFCTTMGIEFIKGENKGGGEKCAQIAWSTVVYTWTRYGIQFIILLISLFLLRYLLFL